MHDTDDPLLRFGRPLGLPAGQLAAGDLAAAPELRFVVVRREHHVAALAPLGVVAVVLDDVSVDRVVVRVDLAHDDVTRSRRGSGATIS